MTPFDLISLAQKAQSVEELVALAREDRIRISEEDAKIYYDRWHGECELSDDDLDAVGGGFEEMGAEVLVCEVCGDKLGMDISEGGWYCYKCKQHRSGIKLR